MSKLPKISIVTPSYNQGDFLEQTILSVIRQNYPNLQYIIIDGGSTDNSVDIIKKYEKHIDYWISEKDKGQYDAVLKGFKHADGDILAWLNSDDIYLPWTFDVVYKAFNLNDNIKWISTLTHNIIKEDGSFYKNLNLPGFSRDAFLKGLYSTPSLTIQQEGTFWRKEIFDLKRFEELVDNYTVALDFALWCEFYKHSELIGINVPLASFRTRESQRSRMLFNKYCEESKIALNALRKDMDYKHKSNKIFRGKKIEVIDIYNKKINMNNLSYNFKHLKDLKSKIYYIIQKYIKN